MTTKEELFEKNEKLVGFVIKLRFRTFDQDMLQVGYLGLWKACLAFDENICPRFASFAIKTITNEILAYLKKENRNKKIITYTDKELEIGVCYPYEIDELKMNLTNREKEILDLKMKGFGVSEISKILKLSRSFIYKKLNKIKEKISNEKY